MKKAVISTSGLNCYGSRVMTEGIDLEQYKKNPVILYMHKRGFDGKSTPIGKMVNLTAEGDSLIGEPDFDVNDPFAKAIADKWENGYLKMFSAGLEIIETSVDPQTLLPGQTRATVMKSKLTEVSVVDIGGNDEAIQLLNEGKLLTLAQGETCDVLPLVKNVNEDDNIKPNKTMNKEFLALLGLSETATEQEALKALKLMKVQADKAGAMELAAITTAVETAISEKRVTEAKKNHFIELGKKVGIDTLRDTLQLMQPAMKPTQVINKENGTAGAQVQGELQLSQMTKLSEVPADKIEEVKLQHPKEYARLYKGEYGIDYATI